MADRARLGTNLPPELLQRTPTLSGTVFEVLEDGRRVALAGARVDLDGLWGMGVVIATTVTGADGRYVLCGLDGDRESYLYATLARTCCSNRNVYLISTSSMASRLGPSIMTAL